MGILKNGWLRTLSKPLRSGLLFLAVLSSTVKMATTLNSLLMTAATVAALNGTDPFRLQEAGSWASLAMPRRYVEVVEVAIMGVKLSG